MDKKRPEVLGSGWKGVSLCSLNLLRVGLLFLVLVLDPYRWDQPRNEQLGILAKPCLAGNICSSDSDLLQTPQWAGTPIGGNSWVRGRQEVGLEGTG